MTLLRTTLAAAVLALAGCASTADGDPRDPLEPMNRAIYRFNEVVDEAVAKPVATVYRDAVPEPARGYVRNFFGNIADVFIGANNLLQGKVGDGLQDWFRVAVNTVLGPFGINDWASEMGIEKHNEDFGQTFGWWGIGPGPYLILPIFGSSTARDGVGTLVDWYTDPVGEVRPVDLRNSMVVTRLVGVRADLLEASRILEQAALDKYTFQRDAFLQRRQSLVHDGRPPRERYEDDAPAAPEDKQPAPDKVNEAPGPGVDRAAASNVFLPRIPSNYPAVMAAGTTHANTR
ncbi:MAG TPA: VacJ family lipoprotein [Burkholderiales bacterium]|nr:VacJ family lipoprotein [Burkholderiales bacterium]